MGAPKFVIRDATREAARVRIGLVAPSGAGKTYTSLAIATGLVERDDSEQPRIVVLDTEHRSSEKYADAFRFQVLELPSYDPQVFAEAIAYVGELGQHDVIVIDSLSHAWMGEGGALAMVDAITKKSRSGNSFTAWGDVTPRHRAMIDAILSSLQHVIATMRAKTEYVMDEVVGKGGRTIQVPRKVGLAPVQRDGMEYEFDLVADLDQDHNLIISKSRLLGLDVTGIESGIISRPGESVGKAIREWCSVGADPAKRKLERDNCELVRAIEGFIDRVGDADLRAGLAALVDYGQALPDAPEIQPTAAALKSAIKAEPDAEHVLIDAVGWSVDVDLVSPQLSRAAVMYAARAWGLGEPIGQPPWTRWADQLGGVQPQDREEMLRGLIRKHNPTPPDGGEPTPDAQPPADAVDESGTAAEAHLVNEAAESGTAAEAAPAKLPDPDGVYVLARVVGRSRSFPHLMLPLLRALGAADDDVPRPVFRSTVRAWMQMLEDGDVTSARLAHAATVAMRESEYGASSAVRAAWPTTPDQLLDACRVLMLERGDHIAGELAQRLGSPDDVEYAVREWVRSISAEQRREVLGHLRHADTHAEALDALLDNVGTVDHQLAHAEREARAAYRDRRSSRGQKREAAKGEERDQAATIRRGLRARLDEALVHYGKADDDAYRGRWLADLDELPPAKLRSIAIQWFLHLTGGTAGQPTHLHLPLAIAWLEQSIDGGRAVAVRRLLEVLGDDADTRELVTGACGDGVSECILPPDVIDLVERDDVDADELRERLEAVAAQRGARHAALAARYAS